VWSKPYSEYRVIFVKNWFTFLILIFVWGKPYSEYRIVLDKNGQMMTLVTDKWWHLERTNDDTWNGQMMTLGTDKWWHLERIWEMFGKCLGNVWEMFGTFLSCKSMIYVFFWEMFGKCLGNVWEMFGKCLGILKGCHSRICSGVLLYA
jgi:hypothetical protein